MRWSTRSKAPESTSRLEHPFQGPWSSESEEQPSSFLVEIRSEIDKPPQACARQDPHEFCRVPSRPR